MSPCFRGSCLLLLVFGSTSAVSADVVNAVSSEWEGDSEAHGRQLRRKRSQDMGAVPTYSQAHAEKEQMIEDIMMQRRRSFAPPKGVVFLARSVKTTQPGGYSPSDPSAGMATDFVSISKFSDSGLAKIFEAQYDVVNDNSTYCMRERFMCKYTPQCTRRRPKCVGKVFITGCSGSGTHSVASTLAAVSDKGNAVTHEAPRDNLAALVSWPTRCSESKSPKLQYLKYGFRETDIKKPMKGWAQKQLNSKCMYRTVVQVVRHPLSFLSSNLAFGQCVECWSLVEQLSVPPIYLYTKRIRAAIKHNRKALYETTGGRTWDTTTINVLLQGFMLYWVTWNRMIESVADMRFRVEHTDLRELCELLQLGSASSCQKNPLTKYRSGAHGGEKDVITWPQLEQIDADLAREVWLMAEAYGYNRTVPVRAKPPVVPEEEKGKKGEKRNKKGKANPNRKRQKQMMNGMRMRSNELGRSS